MQDLNVTAYEFNPNPYWDVPIDGRNVPTYVVSELFDQNGYDLSYVEQLFADKNETYKEKHKPHRVALRKTWMHQNPKKEGAVLNHALLFERKGYIGEALEQLKRWSWDQPVYHKMINIKPKWGLDFSMDFYDRQGRTFEVLHWEYDCFDHDEAVEAKQSIEPKLLSIDWDDAAEQIWKRRDDWYSLDFFKQSEYKCKYFGIIPERFKMIVWN